MAAPAEETSRIPQFVKDPYRLNPEDVVEPPRSLWQILKRIGPGLILCASIVGSGELIATTTLGAQAGYVALWVILLSCFIKTGIQVEMGRYTIATGETGLESFNRFPGPRWRINWVVGAWALMVAMTLFQVGAMFGGVAQVMNQLLPNVPINLWVLLFLILTLILLLGGGYERIEKIAMVKVALFTMLTFLCALLLIRMPQYFAWGRVWDGLKFHMPPGGLTKAVAVFGITGVGASELFMYPYWCVEKGYARFAGSADGSPEWRARALGWSRVMEVDAVASMIIYTIATIAFYMLGAGILNGMGLVPAAREMIPVLSNMYTKTLGPWALWLFYLGAIATLYGTVFAATAAHSRLYADMFRLMGFFRRDDYAARVRFRRRFVWFLTIVPAVLYWLFREPVSMVFIGGLAQFSIMPVIAIVTLYLRHRHLPAGIAPSRLRTVGTWIAAAVIVGFMLVYLASLARAEEPAFPRAQQTAVKRVPDVPYEPSSPEIVSGMLKLANVRKGDVVYDLGCGDGRIVIAAVQKFGARGVGIDIDPERIAEARENARKAGVTRRVTFRNEDLFTAKISDATVVMLYLWPEVNLRLRPKLWKELKPGTRIVSHSHTMGDWEPEKEIEVEGHRIYYWTIPAKTPRSGS